MVQAHDAVRTNGDESLLWGKQGGSFMNGARSQVEGLLGAGRRVVFSEISEWLDLDAGGKLPPRENQ